MVTAWRRQIATTAHNLKKVGGTHTSFEFYYSILAPLIPQWNLCQNAENNSSTMTSIDLGSLSDIKKLLDQFHLNHPNHLNPSLASRRLGFIFKIWHVGIIRIKIRAKRTFVRFHKPTPYNQSWSTLIITRYSILSCRVEHDSDDGKTYNQTFNTRRTKSQNLKASRLVLQLPLSNPLKPSVKSRMV